MKMSGNIYKQVIAETLQPQRSDKTGVINDLEDRQDVIARPDSKGAEELPDTHKLAEFIKHRIKTFFHELPTSEIVLMPSFITITGTKPIDIRNYFRQRVEGTISMCIELVERNYIQDETWKRIVPWFETEAVGKIIDIQGRQLKVMRMDLYNNRMAIVIFKIMPKNP